MKINQPPPRSSAIGPLTPTSHVERSVVCQRCQKAHGSGFIWNFSETLRFCFTCYREMGEDARKGYEREAKAEAKKAARQQGGPKDALKVIGLLALLIVILLAGAWFLGKPLASGIVEQRVPAAESRLPANR